MTKTVVRKNESLEDALRRFKRTVSKSGTIQEFRKREYYEKPSVKRKKNSEAARKRKYWYPRSPLRPEWQTFKRMNEYDETGNSLRDFPVSFHMGETLGRFHP